MLFLKKVERYFLTEKSIRILDVYNGSGVTQLKLILITKKN